MTVHHCCHLQGRFTTCRHGQCCRASRTLASPWAVGSSKRSKPSSSSSSSSPKPKSSSSSSLKVPLYNASKPSASLSTVATHPVVNVTTSHSPQQAYTHKRTSVQCDTCQAGGLHEGGSQDGTISTGLQVWRKVIWIHSPLLRLNHNHNICSSVCGCVHIVKQLAILYCAMFIIRASCNATAVYQRSRRLSSPWWVTRVVKLQT